MKLQVKDIAVSYEGQMILEHLNLEIKEEEFVSIVGTSGCGKSTLLNILAGVLPAEMGKVIVDGEEIKGLSSHFAYMPQDDLLLPWKKILDNVCLYSAIHGSKSEARKEAMKNTRRFGLAGYENKYPRELSGGMRQRAAFLRTALCKADIMLLDEPFASLDVITRGDMQDWLYGMRSALSRTTMLVTHDIDEAIFLSDRVLVLSGRPASVRREIAIEEKNRSREWLADQKPLWWEIYDSLKG